MKSKSKDVKICQQRAIAKASRSPAVECCLQSIWKVGPSLYRPDDGHSSWVCSSKLAFARASCSAVRCCCRLGSWYWKLQAAGCKAAGRKLCDRNQSCRPTLWPKHRSKYMLKSLCRSMDLGLAGGWPGSTSTDTWDDQESPGCHRSQPEQLAGPCIPFAYAI